MPTYDYACKQCGHRFEAFQSMKDDALTICPACEAEALQRMIGAGAGLVFKGSGFYLTDYKNAASASASKNGGNGNGAAASGNGAAADGKSADGSSGSADSENASTGSATPAADTSTTAKPSKPVEQ
jgi:putative FmdB family regulatory protein